MLPTPRRLYVHDDLTEDLRTRFGDGSPVVRCAAELLKVLTRGGGRVRLITLDEQLTALIARGPHTPFALALGIGRAGEAVARQVDARTGWFPTVRQIALTREEDEQGDYTLVSTTGEPLPAQLGDLDGVSSLAVVDDTVYSGLTMGSVLAALPSVARTRTRAFCLRAVAESLSEIRPLCPIDAGFVADGRRDEDVSFINASGLVMRGAIRRAGRPPLAFYERPAWIHAWFPGEGHEVIARCRELRELLGQPDLAVR